MTTPLLLKLAMEVLQLSAKTTSWVTLIAGIIVAVIGQIMRPGEFASGVLGFGLAHIFLGIIDMLRPAVREQS